MNDRQPLWDISEDKDDPLKTKKNVYLHTPINRYKYMHIPINLIPDNFIAEYIIENHIKNVFYIEIFNDINGLTQAKILTTKLPTKHRNKYGYNKTSMFGLFCNLTLPVTFTLVVDNFGFFWKRKH